MSKFMLQGHRILIVEDEYLLADELQNRLADIGAIILGPVGSVEDSSNLIAREQQIDGAILDVNLNGEPIFSVAKLLIERNIPFIFTTGYDRSSIPNDFSQVICCEKPVVIYKIADAIKKAILSRQTI